jgi:hypothetical protein
MGLFVRTIWYLSIGVTFVLLVRLIVTKLFLTYRNLFLFLVVNAVQALLLAVLQSNLNRYAQVYMSGQLLKMVISVFMVIELYFVALASHPALARFGKKLVAYALGLAGVIAACGVVLDSAVLPGQSQILHRFFTAERTIDFAVLLFLLLISGFMLWFPIRMKWNIALYLGGFMVFFIAQSFGLLMVNLLPRALFGVMSNIMLCVSLGCLLTWLFALRQDDRNTVAFVGHRWDPAAIGRLTGQLDQINAALLRFGRQ